MDFDNDIASKLTHLKRLILKTKTNYYWNIWDIGSKIICKYFLYFYIKMLTYYSSNFAQKGIKDVFIILIDQALFLQIMYYWGEQVFRKISNTHLGK